MSNNEIEAAQQYMLELLYSQASDHLSSDHFQQQHDAEEAGIPVFMEENDPLGPILVRTGDKQRPPKSSPQISLPDCCRVPTTLRHLEKEAYTPKVVSIGPFHHGNDRLQDMERHKKIMFERFTQRAESSKDDLYCFVQHILVPKMLDSYSETIDLPDRSELRDMILLDASFIIELFMCHEMEEDNNDKLSQPWLKDSIMHDLLLLENQLPFVIIEDLFKRAFRDSDTSFLELTYEYFGGYNRKKLTPNPNGDIVRIKHFTDLLRLFYLPEKMPPRRNLSTGEESQFLLYNANALQAAGIKLKATESKCLLDLKLSGHNRLEIPKILVEDHTELVFRNMIALEQCHYPYDAYITDYATVLDCLIDTSKDVDLLVEKEIVHHYLGDSHSVASLFNGLGKNVIQTDFNSEYFKMNQRLNCYCKNPWNKMKATLRRDYCNTPWRTMASIAGIIIVVFTIVGTIFSGLQVVLK